MIGDVGQDTREEVDLLRAGQGAGSNRVEPISEGENHYPGAPVSTVGAGQRRIQIQ